MPGIQSQSINVISSTHVQVTIVTSFYGTLLVDVLQTGGGANATITITAFQNDAQTAQSILTNPVVATVESTIDTEISNILPKNNLGQPAFQFHSHVLSWTPNPISIAVMCADAGATVSPTWWQV